MDKDCLRSLYRRRTGHRLAWKDPGCRALSSTGWRKRPSKPQRKGSRRGWRDKGFSKQSMPIDGKHNQCLQHRTRAGRWWSSALTFVYFITDILQVSPTWCFLGPFTGRFRTRLCFHTRSVVSTIPRIYLTRRSYLSAVGLPNCDVIMSEEWTHP